MVDDCEPATGSLIMAALGCGHEGFVGWCDAAVSVEIRSFAMVVVLSTGHAIKGRTGGTEELAVPVVHGSVAVEIDVGAAETRPCTVQDMWSAFAETDRSEQGDTAEGGVTRSLHGTPAMLGQGSSARLVSITSTTYRRCLSVLRPVSCDDRLGTSGERGLDPRSELFVRE